MGSENGHRGDKRSGQGQEEFVHFAGTIQTVIDINQLADYIDHHPCPLQAFSAMFGPTILALFAPFAMKFHGTKNYVATQDLMLSVNAAITLQRPLLVKGEPGTGKTMLAEEVAAALDMPLLQWHIKSTTKAQQGLYEYDAVSRLRDSQLSDIDGGERVKDIQQLHHQGRVVASLHGRQARGAADRRDRQGGH